MQETEGFNAQGKPQNSNTDTRLNRVLLAFCIGVWLIFVLLFFTSIAEEVIAAIALVATFLGYLFPGITSLHQQSWFQRPLVTAALSILFTIGVMLNLFLIRSVPPEIEPPPAISLVSLRYRTSNWNQRLVDLRKAVSSGIPVKAGQQLQLGDILVSVSEDSVNYTLQAEVYIGGTNQLIGATKKVPLYRGIVDMEDVAIRSYNDGDDPNFWKIQDGWTDLLIAFIAYAEDGQSTVVNRTSIRLDPKGTAWLFEPPNFSLASLVYRVNDSPNQVLDLRYANELGIDLKPGHDDLLIQEIWYYANADGNSIKAQFQLDEDGTGLVNDDPLHQTDRVEIEQGIHPITGAEKYWEVVPEDRNYLVVKLLREDATIIQELAIPFKSPGGLGLIPHKEVERWYSEFIDFEAQTQVEEWRGDEFTTVFQSTEQAYTGQNVLAVRSTATSSALFALWTQDFSADMIVGQIFWPVQDGIDIQWAQVCVRTEGFCTSIPEDQGQWNTFVFNLNQRTYNGQPLNTRTLEELLFQGNIIGISEENPYTFYVDSIQIFHVNQSN